MMQPKRTRYRKQQKGRNRGLSLARHKVSFASTLKAITGGRLTARRSRPRVSP